jgi:RNA-directed DNA polymerase
LIDNIPVDKTILQKWLKAGFVYQKQLFPTESGTPQGGIISPVLANMTLDGLEYALAKAFPSSIKKGLKMIMVRYADDLIITGHSKEWLEQEVMPVLVSFLAKRGLTLSPEKTRITHITEGCDFLAACRTNNSEAVRKKALGFLFYVHFCNRKPYQAHSTPKSQLPVLYS